MLPLSKLIYDFGLGLMGEFQLVSEPFISHKCLTGECPNFPHVLDNAKRPAKFPLEIPVGKWWERVAKYRSVFEPTHLQTTHTSNRSVSVYLIYNWDNISACFLNQISPEQVRNDTQRALTERWPGRIWLQLEGPPVVRCFVSPLTIINWPWTAVNSPR